MPAVIKVRWTVEELANVMTLFDRQKVYRSTTGATGTYSEITAPLTRVLLVVGVTSYYFDDTSGAENYWYKVSYFNAGTSAESELSDPIAATGGGNYVTLQDMRDEGVTVSQASDARLLRLIDNAEAYVERITGRWFYPRQCRLREDGDESRILQLGAPIICVNQVQYLYEQITGAPVTGDLQLDSLRVYNRHLTMGLSTPDDREAPRLILETYERSDIAYFPKGRQNVIVSGWFGYTELQRGMPIGETSTNSQVPLSYGGTPLAIKDCVMRLVVRSIPQIGDTDAVEDATLRPFVQTMTTRDQSITFGTGRTATKKAAPFTGDPLIDDTLAMYSRPAQASLA